MYLQCDQCNKPLGREHTTLLIPNEGVLKCFCGDVCKHIFKSKHERDNARQSSLFPKKKVHHGW